MKPIMNTLLTAFVLLIVSCKKESTVVQSSSNDERVTQALSSEANEIASGRAVRIGTQVWMTKNLDVTRYRNGDRIPHVKDPLKWGQLTTGAWCWYNNDSANCAIYGKLYNWYAVNDPRGLAPEGWHVPSDVEWHTLERRLNPFTGAGKMKSTGTIEAGTGLWYAPNTGATNSSGFTGLPGGSRRGFYTSTFYYIGYSGEWWSSTEYDTTYVWIRFLYYSDDIIFRDYHYKYDGVSVRCIRD